MKRLVSQYTQFSEVIELDVLVLHGMAEGQLRDCDQSLLVLQKSAPNPPNLMISSCIVITLPPSNISGIGQAPLCGGKWSFQCPRHPRP